MAKTALCIASYADTLSKMISVTRITLITNITNVTSVIFRSLSTNGLNSD